ncbi:MAG: caspase family protein [Bacteroidales bacterium]|nr:caspase family protein [Bacteroidales bacterium]
MMRTVLRWFILLSLTASCSFAYAYKNTYAVIIGIADYKEGNSDLTFTTRDAQLFCDFLMSSAGGNVPASNIYLLKDSKATKNNILYYTRQLFSRASEDDRVIFFFSGHGCAGYLLPYDVTKYGANFLSYEEVKELFRCAKAKTKLMLADACFAGDFRNSMPKNQKSINTKARKSSDIAIMLSCSDNEYSMETASLRQGIFSYYLVKGLKGAADRDGNKIITIQELFYYVYKQTRHFAKNAGRDQKPVLFGNFDLRLIVGYVR